MSIAGSAATFGRLLPALRSERPGMARTYVVGTVSGLALVALGVLTASAVGNAVVHRSLPGTWWWAVVVGLVLARTLLTWHEMDVSHALAYRVLARLREALFDAYSRSMPGRRREHSGRAASVAMDGIERLEFFYAHTVAQIASAVTVFAASTVAAAAILPEAGAVVAVGAVGVFISSLVGARTARQTGEAQERERSALSVQIVDTLGALREVLAYDLVDEVIADTDTATRRAAHLHRRGELLEWRSEALRDVVVSAVSIGVLAVSAAAAGIVSGTDDPRLSPAWMPPLVALALAGVSAISDAAATVARLHPLAADASRIADDLERSRVVTPPARPVSVPVGRLGLAFDRVDFSYEDRPPTLRSWSLTVAPGEHIGLAGPSGTGKSTILALAARLWDVDGGRITLVAESGDADLADLADAELHGTVALVDQDAAVFSGTVRDNLLRGTRTRPDAALSETLRLVGLADRVALDDEIGQGGLLLSGGQRARLCLARALVREPRILLVDEVTASLDPDTERAVSDVIAMYDGTVVVASHRTQTLARLDRVVHIGSTTEPTDPRFG